MKRIGMLTLAGFFCFASAAWPQGQPQAKTQIEKTGMTYTNPHSGQEMYTAYCAVCHGLTGKGDGPAAPALKTPAANLTELSKNNGGKYPALRVEAILEFGVPTTAHGSKEMPIWGPLFDSLVHNASRAETHMRIMNLTDYLKTLQTR